MIGHDPVDAEREQGLDLGELVDGPDVDLDAVGVGMFDERGRDEGTARELRGDLEGHDALGHRLAAEGTRDHGEHLAEARPERRPNRRDGHRTTQSAHDRILAGREQRPIGAVVPLDQAQGLAQHGFAFAFDLEIEAGVGKTLEGFFEARDPDAATEEGPLAPVVLVPEAGVERAQRRPGPVRRRARDAAGALEGRVVEQDRDAVPADVDVALEDRRAVAERRLEGEEGVLRMVAGGAAVADHDRMPEREEWMRHPGRVS